MQTKMDTSKTRAVLDCDMSYNQVVDIVFEDEEPKLNIIDEENSYYEPESSNASTSNSNDDISEPVYEEIPDFNRSLPLPTLPPRFRGNRYQGRLHVVRSTGNLAGSKGSLYDKLIRRHNGLEHLDNQSHLCSSCSRIISPTYPEPIRHNISFPSHLEEQSPGKEHFFRYSTGSYTNRVLLARSSFPEEEDPLSVKFQRMNDSKSTWTDAETIFLSFYSEGVDKLHIVPDEEECDKVIFFGLGLPLLNVDTLPPTLQIRYKKIKKIIINVCKFSIRIGVIPVVHEKARRKKSLPSHTSLKVLFKLGIHNSENDFIILDSRGKMFRNIKEWEKSIKLWNSIVVFPQNGELTMDKDGEPDIIVSDTTRKKCIRTYALQFSDITAGVTGISTLGIGAIVAFSVGTVVLPVLIVEGVVLAYSGIRVLTTLMQKRRQRARFKGLL